MTRHKLSLSVDYVSTWGVQEALRELFQNAIDWGDWSFTIDGDRLSIISHNASLEPKTILLGSTSKRDDSSKIGVHGEGYKLAMLVLTRLGYPCEIHTGSEIWEPKLIQSRTYKTQQLVFDTRVSNAVKQSLSFEVSGLSEAVLTELNYQNLHINPTVAFYCHDKGVVVPNRPGDIFVNGLFVAHLEGYKFGYNFKPSSINLDRDRRLVRDFDVQWVTSQIWKDYEDFDLILDMIKAELPDVKYLDSFIYSSKQGLADEAAKAFVTEYGPEAVPVTSQLDLRNAQEAGHESIILVPDCQRQLIYRSSFYTPPAPKIIKKTPREVLLDYSMKWRGLMVKGDMRTEFDELIKQAEKWYT
jgi:hypothetical protein